MNAIEIQNLSYCYPDGTEALKNVSLTVGGGKKLAILGANGSGKSTLLAHLNGLLTAQVGSVQICGDAITKKNLRTIRQKVGILFDNPDNQLFSTTVFDDVAFGPYNMGLSESEIKERTNNALHQTGLTALADRLPQNLSLGQKKKSAIAGLLAMTPRILVMDEPFSGLDATSIAEFLGILDDLHKKGVTLVISTHNVDHAYAWADEVAILNEGQLAASETYELLHDETLLVESRLRLPMLVQLFQGTEYRPRNVQEAQKLMQRKENA